MIVVWMMWEGFGIKKMGYTLFDGRSEIKDDKDSLPLLESPEIDGWYYLYIVHRWDNMGEKNPKTTYIYDVVFVLDNCVVFLVLF